MFDAKVKYMKTAKSIIAVLICLAGVSLCQAEVIEPNQYAIWGIGADEIVIPAGSVITDAVLTIENVSPANTPLYVHLLDNPNKGFALGTDSSGGNVFDGYGVPLVGTYQNGNFICRLSQINDSQSSIWQVFAQPCTMTLAGGSTVSFSSSLLELMDYAGNGRGLGIGVDSAAGVEVTLDSLKLDITTKTYQGVAASQTLSFAYDLTGLVAHWKLDDNSNSTNVIDSSGFGISGTAYRNTLLVSATGVVGSAFGFDGVSDYIQVSPDEAINQYGRGSLAVSAWIYPRSLGQGGEGRIVSKRGNGYDFYLTGTNQIGVYIPHISKAAWRISLSNAIKLNTWQHVAFVYNENGNQSVALYVNGVLQNGGQDIAGQGVLSDDRQNKLTIGRYSATNSRQFDGFIDDVRIYGQFIKSLDVLEMYNRLIAVEVSPMAHWKLDDNSNSTNVIDSSGFGISGTAYRNTLLVSATGVVGSAFGFDGVSDYIQVSPDEAINQYGRGSLAVSAWIYPRSLGQGGEGRIVSKRGNGYDFYLTGTNQIGVYIPHISKAAWRISLSNAIKLNTWQHVAFVYNENGNQSVALYVNGVLQNGGQDIAGQGVLSDDRQNKLTIGRYSATNSRQFDGFIDDVRIYGQFITSSQINCLYNSKD